MTKDRYTPGEVRKMLHISPMALRYYMKKGLISAEKDEDNGYHSFGEEEIFDLMEISYLRQVLDFSTDEIHEYLTSSSINGYIDILDRRKEQLVREIEEKQRQLKIIESWEYWLREVIPYKDAMEVIELDIPCHILIPRDQQRENCLEMYQDPLVSEDPIYGCCIFDLRGETPVYTEYGFYFENIEQARDAMSLYDCRMEVLPAGKYVYGLFSSDKAESDPEILVPFMEYVGEHGLRIGGTAYSSMYYIDRNRSERQFCYDVFIPLVSDGNA